MQAQARKKVVCKKNGKREKKERFTFRVIKCVVEESALHDDDGHIQRR